jgi:hypothetical protein
MPLSRGSRVSLIVGVAAIALTIVSFGLFAENPYRDPHSPLTRPLAFGVFVAAIPFGGIHEISVSNWWIVAGGSLINGLFVSGLTRAEVSFYRGVRRARTSAASEHE